MKNMNMAKIMLAQMRSALPNVHPSQTRTRSIKSNDQNTFAIVMGFFDVMSNSSSLRLENNSGIEPFPLLVFVEQIHNILYSWIHA